MQKRRAFLFLLLLFCFSLLSAQGMQSPSEIIKTELASMKLDLQTLKISIANYKTKILDLQILLEASMNDLTKSQEELIELEKLLADSKIKLQQMETQLIDLSNDYELLKKRSKFYSRATKILLPVSVVSIAVNILLIISK